MADINELHQALINADAAGDTAAATALAQHIQSLSEQQPSNNVAPIVSPAGANKPPLSWGDVATQAASNLPSSVGNVLSGIGHAVMHPFDTAGQIIDLGAGELSKALPSSVSNFIDKYDPNPQAGTKAKETATAFNNTYTNPVNGYGSMEGFKTKLANDPASVLADASTVLTGGAGTLTKAGKLGNILADTGSMLNPISSVPVVAKGVGTVAGVAADKLGSLAAHTLGSGAMTGVGGQTVKTAFNSGLARDGSFIDNIMNKVPATDVLDVAKDNLSNMKADRSATYQAQMADLLNNKSNLSYDAIDKAINDAAGTATYNGVTVNERAASAIQKAKDAVDQWKSNDPNMFSTPQGLDKLKQKIGDIQEGLPFEESRARKAVGGIYDAVKDTISQQVPAYKKTMSDYAAASNNIDDITKSLSLGDKASVDTAVRKLQSLTRNNVHSNYGHRTELANLLVDQGGNDIMPALAGQAMNSWTGRGLIAHGSSGGIGMAAMLGHPAALAALPFQSPKLVGLGAYGAGRLVGLPGQAAEAIGAAIPSKAAALAAQNTDKAKALSLILQQATQQQGAK